MKPSKRKLPNTTLPDLSRTERALRAYDRKAPALERKMLRAETDAGVLAVLVQLEALGRDVGDAYGEDTEDRNSRSDCADLIRPGPPVAPPGGELSFVRRMVAKWRAEQKPITLDDIPVFD